MPDEFTEITRVGLGGRLKGSFMGVVFGALMFFGSFVLLWVNEGRVNLAKVAQTAVEVNATQIDSSAEGKLISVSALLKTDEDLGDPEYLKPGNYIKLVRIVEMFAWKEQVSERTEQKVGGSETRIKTYKYKRGWTRHPSPSTSFKHPENHTNPPLTVSQETFVVQSAQVGLYKINPKTITFPIAKPLALSSENVILKPGEKLSTGENNYIFKGSLLSPEVGDVRISFRSVKSGIEVTAFGKLKGETITPFFYGKEGSLESFESDDDTDESAGRLTINDKEISLPTFFGKKLHRVLRGDRDEAIATLSAEHKFISWMLRLVGFLMMWIGMMLFFGPLTTLLGILPFLASLGRALVSLITLPIALVLSSITIILSMIFHSIIALLIILGLLFVGLLLLVVCKRKKRLTRIYEPRD
ncbi:TMEM43 family protein [Candidatus Babeliales bacterium]|nr:TMEM43 family protein [Candidatus Babeliales bacterium]